MTAALDATGSALAEGIGAPPKARRAGRLVFTPARSAMAGVAVLLLLSVVRQITKENGLTSSVTFGAALRLAVPIGLAGLGALWAERAGVINIGLEGMMILGTWFGAWAGSQYNSWWAVVAGILGGALGGLLHAVATVTFGVDHIISGVAINILAAGVARYLSVIAWQGKPGGGGATQSPQIKGHIGTMSLPILSGGKLFGWHSPDFLGWLEKRRWFFLSDVGGVLHGVTSNIHPLTLIALILVPITAFILWRTALGLRLRSVGEAPAAAESLGVPVYTMKYIGVVVSGALAGLAGAFIVVTSAGIYREGQTAGHGFIGLACLIFGNYRPFGVALGAGLFGFIDALSNGVGKPVHAMLLVIGPLVAAAAVWSVWRRRVTPGLIMAGLAALAFVWFGAAKDVPSQIIYFFPHVTTLVVLAVAGPRLRPPAADGIRYRKGTAV